MARWIPDRQLVVTAAPGTGSTSLIATLDRMEGTAVVPSEDRVVDGVTVVDQKHATVAELVAAELFDPPPGSRIVTTTRNPFDFWPSEWERTRRRWVRELRDPGSWVHRQPGMIDRIVDAVEMEFPAWVLHALDTDITARRCRHLNDGHVGEADIVVRMEHLDHDLQEHAGLDLAVDHLNRTEERRPYWQYYDRASREAVAAVYAPTLDRFGYCF